MANLTWKRGVVVGALIVATGLLVSACGTTTPTASSHPKTHQTATKHFPKPPIAISTVNSDVASYLQATLHLRKVVIGKAPSGATGLQAFLADPSASTVNTVRPEAVPVGTYGWTVADGTVAGTVPTNASQEQLWLTGLLQSDFSGLSPKILTQIKTSPAVYVDFAYSTSDQLFYVVFWHQ